MREIAIIGGGLAGLISAIILKRTGRDVVLIEKKSYPFHKVCGEYISNEVMSFLERHQLFPHSFQVSQIDTFRLSAINGKDAFVKLGLGGFGISRYSLDNFLYQTAIREGVDCMTGVSVREVDFISDHEEYFNLTLSNNNVLNAMVVVGAHGKRSVIDKSLNRSFIQKKSPYVGIKYHIKYELPSNEVVLHNFKGGYCGLNNVEGGKVNLCYLTNRENLKKCGSIPELEKKILSKNPHLAEIFSEATFLFNQPEVINEISFETKKPIENHMLMCGDAAGMIAPLCGNGMAMAIHSTKILTECINDGFNATQFDRKLIEQSYEHQWEKTFAHRLAIGRQLQKLFGNGWLSGLTVDMIKYAKPLAKMLIEKSHGKPF